MNYIVISPYYPANFQPFSYKLRQHGVNVLGIGQEPYDQLNDELKATLTEYFRVDNLEDLDQVTRAVAFFFHKYGPIDRIESHNEYWLELDAGLRQQFNIFGVKPQDLTKTKYKSVMKEYFRKAGVPVVDGRVVSQTSEIEAAVQELGLPLIAKPDNGVGAAATYKLMTPEDVAQFKATWGESTPYFLEQFVSYPTVTTFDGLIDAQGNIVFETGLTYYYPPLELVLERKDNAFYIEKEVHPKLREYGHAIIKSFGMKERFFHIEFFRRKKGDYVAIEYNNRLAGGYTIDLYNYAYGCDLYAIYADIVTRRLEETPSYDRHYGVGISRRDELSYAHNVDEIRARYGDRVKMVDRLPDAFSAIMGNEFLVVLADTQEEVEEVSQYVHKKQGGQ